MLRLTPFEEYMFRDDRETYPMSFFIRLRFSGDLNVETVRIAYESAVARHPLLHSVVAENSKGKYFWMETSKMPDFRSIETDDPERLPHAPRLLLSEEPGIRLWSIVRSNDSGRQKAVTDLLFQVHHACCDAIGLATMIEDFIRIYNEKTGTNRLRIASPPNPKTLPRRDRLSWSFPSVLKSLWRIPAQAMDLYGFVRTYTRKPTPVVPMTTEQQQRPHGADALALTYRIYDIDIFHSMKQTARQIGVTLNDLLMRDLFRVLDRFRYKYHWENIEKPLRLAIPVNLRSYGRGNQHVANVVGLVFVDRNPNGKEPESLLKSIHREMTRSKWFCSCLTFNSLLRFCRMIPGLLAAELRRARKVWASCVFSNLGPLFQTSDLPRKEGRILCGPAVLQDIVFLPPIRAWTAVSVGMATYDGILSIGLHYDSRFLTEQQAEEFQSLLHEQILTYKTT